jgi:hypothetical protein
MTRLSTSGMLMEWGPAHLRDDATTHEVEPSDRPDDN